MAVKGFELYEIIAIPIVNFNLGGYSYGEATNYVKEGKGRWTICWAMTLTFVPIDYKLKEHEYFVERGLDGMWCEVK